MLRKGTTHPRNWPTPALSVGLGPARARKRDEVARERSRGTTATSCTTGMKASIVCTKRNVSRSSETLPHGLPSTISVITSSVKSWITRPKSRGRSCPAYLLSINLTSAAICESTADSMLGSRRGPWYDAVTTALRASCRAVSGSDRMDWPEGSCVIVSFFSSLLSWETCPVSLSVSFFLSF